MDDDIRVLRRLIDSLDSRNIARLAFPRLTVDAFGITLDAHFQRTFDEYFNESRDLPAGPVAISLSVCGGIEDHGYSVFGQDTANEGERAVEILTVLLI